MITVNVESEFDPAKLKRSIAHLETAVRTDSRNTRYRKVLAEAYLAARRFEDGLDQLEAVWADRPDPRTAYLLGYALFRLGRLREAEEYVGRIEPGTNVGFSRMHDLRGRIAMERGDFAEAVNQFSKAMMLKPNALRAQWNMAGALVAYATETTTDCTPLFRRALSLLKDMKVPTEWADERHELLGRTYLALHHPVEALRHLERSQRPASAEKSMLLGFAYLLHGHNEQAQGFLKEAALNQDVRPRCFAYLEEVAMTPRHLLSRMGVKTGTSAIPMFLDHEYLGEVFGAGAEEVVALLQAGAHPRSDAMDRTQAEAQPEGQTFGRLLAPGEQPREKETSPGSAEVVGVKSSRTPTQGMNRAAEARTEGDRLFPQTLLEVRDPTTKEQPLPGHDDDPTETIMSDDDWDIGLDEDLGFDNDKELPRTEAIDLSDSTENDQEEEHR